MSCPQVDTSIKHYIVKTRTVEQMKHLLERLGPTDDYYLDAFLEEAENG
jgi:hypothetical protein